MKIKPSSAIVNIEDGSYSFNQECKSCLSLSGTTLTRYFTVYAIAQAQRATLPKNLLGPEGKRIASTVSGGLNWALRVNAFVTGCSSIGKGQPFQNQPVV
jgi:hypothetical protein